MRTALMFSTGKDDWRTPPELFAALDREFHFEVDCAADDSNALCSEWFDEHRGGALAWSWAEIARVCWCNPPYSRGLQGKFIAKAAFERERGVTTVMLIPARTDTKAFHKHIWDAEKHQPREGVEVRFLKGRLKFSGCKDAAPFPSMIVVFRPTPCAALESAVERMGKP